MKLNMRYLGRMYEDPDLNNKNQIGKKINDAFNFLKADVVLLEAVAKDNMVYWTDIFLKSEELSKEIRFKLRKTGLTVVDLEPKYIVADCQNYICLSVLSKAQELKKKLES